VTDQPPHHHPEGSDAFTRWGEGAAGLLETHWRKIVGVVAVVLALAGAWALHARSREAAELEAQERLAKITAVYPGGGGNIPESSIRDAVSRYEAFLKDAPDGAARDTARLYLASAYEALDQKNQARAAYEALLKAPPIFAGPARMRLAYLALEEGDPKAASAAFDRVIADAPGLAPQASFELGRMAEAADDKDAAVAAYRNVAKAYPAAPQASEAKARLKALGVELEPAPPTPPAAPVAEGEKAAPAEPAAPANAPAPPASDPPAAVPVPAPAPAEGKAP